MEQIAAWLPVSQQMLDEAEAVAKSQGWDTLMRDIGAAMQASWDRANVAILNGE